MCKVQEAEASGSLPSADKITTTCLLFVPSFAERLYQGDISNWKLLAGKEKRKTTLDHWRVKIMTMVIWQLFKRAFCCLRRTFPPLVTTQHSGSRLPTTAGCFHSLPQKLDSLRPFDFWRSSTKSCRGGASSVGFNGCSDYVHPFGLAAVLPVSSAPFVLGHFCFLPFWHHWVSLGESELQWMRGWGWRWGFIKTDAALIRLCGSTLLATSSAGEM